MKIKTFLVRLIFLLTILVPQTKSPNNFLVRAENATESNQLNQQFKQNLKEMVADKIKNIIEAKKKRGWVGIITAKDETSIKIETATNQVREILLDTQTTVISEQRKPVNLEDLIVGKRILAMGYLNSDDLLLGKRIQILNQPKPKNRFCLVGIISDKSVNEKIVTLTPIKNKDNPFQLTINNQTRIRSIDQNNLDYQDLSIGNKIATIYQEVNGEKKALLIMVLFPILTPTPANESRL